MPTTQSNPPTLNISHLDDGSNSATTAGVARPVNNNNDNDIVDHPFSPPSIPQQQQTDSMSSPPQHRNGFAGAFSNPHNNPNGEEEEGEVRFGKVRSPLLNSNSNNNNNKKHKKNNNNSDHHQAEEDFSNPFVNAAGVKVTVRTSGPAPTSRPTSRQNSRSNSYVSSAGSSSHGGGGDENKYDVIEAVFAAKSTNSASSYLGNKTNQLASPADPVSLLTTTSEKLNFQNFNKSSQQTHMIIEEGKNCSFELLAMNKWYGSVVQYEDADSSLKKAKGVSGGDHNIASFSSDAIKPLRILAPPSQSSSHQTASASTPYAFLMPVLPRLIDGSVAREANQYSSNSNNQTTRSRANSGRASTAASSSRPQSRANSSDSRREREAIASEFGGSSEMQEITVGELSRGHQPQQQRSRRPSMTESHQTIITHNPRGSIAATATMPQAAEDGFLRRIKSAVKKAQAGMEAGPAANRFYFYFPELAKGFIGTANAQATQEGFVSKNCDVISMISAGNIGVGGKDTVSESGTTASSFFQAPHLIDRWIVEFPCSILHHNKPLEGHVIITDRHLCFISLPHSNNYQVRLVVPYAKILGIEECSKNIAVGVAQFSTTFAPFSVAGNNDAERIGNFLAQSGVSMVVNPAPSSLNEAKLSATTTPIFFIPTPTTRGPGVTPKVLQIYLKDGHLIQLFDFKSNTLIDTTPTQNYLFGEKSEDIIARENKKNPLKRRVSNLVGGGTRRASNAVSFALGASGFDSDNEEQDEGRDGTSFLGGDAVDENGVARCDSLLRKKRPSGVSSSSDPAYALQEFYFGRCPLTSSRSAALSSSVNSRATAAIENTIDIQHQTFHRKATDLDRFEAMLEYYWQRGK